MTQQAATVTSHGRFIGIDLNEGIRTSHMLAFYLSCYAAIMLATFVPQTQPFLLNEVLKVDPSTQASSVATSISGVRL